MPQHEFTHPATKIISDAISLLHYEEVEEALMNFLAELDEDLLSATYELAVDTEKKADILKLCIDTAIEEDSEIEAEVEEEEAEDNFKPKDEEENEEEDSEDEELPKI